MTDEGWVQRFTIEGERAEALAEVYRLAGNETRIEPVTPEDMETKGPECASCVEAACGQFVTVLTRRRSKETRTGPGPAAMNIDQKPSGCER